MIALACPLKTDSTTFKNWALAGRGANSTIGVLFIRLYSDIVFLCKSFVPLVCQGTNKPLLGEAIE
jgi:hypothetical protein